MHENPEIYTRIDCLFLVLLFTFSGAILIAPETVQAQGAIRCEMVYVPQLVTDLARATNQVRRHAGQTDMSLDRGLSRAAQRHACDLARRHVVSHTDRAGRSAMKRLRRAGMRVCFSAENIAKGIETPDETVAAWQNSEGHRHNQQSERASRMGFGVARSTEGALYWVGVYAAPCR